MKSNRGFSLLETLLYLGIFAIVGGSLFGILTNVVRMTTREISGDEIAGQLQFTIGTITRLVRESSAIEMATSTATTTIKLRMTNSMQDPTCISLVGGVLKLAQGPDPFQPQNCTATTTDITTSKVVVDSALFKRLEFPGGHDQIAIDLQISNTGIGTNKISRALRSGVSRASAATFDADLLPNADAVYEVGSSIPGGKRWKNAAFSGNLTVAGNMGVGVTNPGTKLTLSGGDDAASTGILQLITAGGTNLKLGGNTTYSWIQSHATKPLYINQLGNNVVLNLGAGNVGIGTAGPTYKLQVNGNAANTTGVWAVASDERLKRDILPIEGALQMVTALQGVGFNWRDDIKNEQFGQDMGFIAQDVERVLPQWVKTDADGYKRIEAIGIDALLVEAIKEQQQQILNQKKEIEVLKEMMMQIQNR